MRRLLPALFAIALLAAAAPSIAQDAAPPPAKCTSLAEVEKLFKADSTPYVELTSTALLGVVTPQLGKIVVFDINDELKLGFEIDGCMSDPLTIGPTLKPITGA